MKVKISKKDDGTFKLIVFGFPKSTLKYLSERDLCKVFEFSLIDSSNIFIPKYKIDSEYSLKKIKEGDRQNLKRLVKGSFKNCSSDYLLNSFIKNLYAPNDCVFVLNKEDLEWFINKKGHSDRTLKKRNPKDWYHLSSYKGCYYEMTLAYEIQRKLNKIK